MAVITKTFSIANISIRASADTVEKRIRSLSGVREAAVDISSNTMHVVFDPDLIDDRRIIQEVRACGYDAYTKELPVQKEESEEEKKTVVYDRSFIVSLGITAGILLMWLLHVPPFIALVLLCELVFISRNLLLEMVRAAMKFTSRNPVLRLSAMALSVICGIVLTFKGADTASLFYLYAALFITVTKLENQLIQNSRNRAADAVRSLGTSLPKTASVYQNHREKATAVEDLQEDQIILIRPNEKVPADGRVVRGFALMNESALTGMETAIEKSEGSYVYANSICLKGSVEVRAERIGSKTAMMRLASLAEKTASDTSFRSPFKNSTKYMFIYISAAALIAFFGWIVSGTSVSMALTVMIAVLACSSLQALNLASENEVMRTAGEAAVNHVLFKSIDALEMVSSLETVLLEQDGTVTDRDLTVTDFIPAEGMSEGRLEYVAYALENRSNRPFAKAITRYLRSRRMSAVNMQEFTSLSKKGRSALQSLSSYRCGTYDETLERGVITEGWEQTIQALRKEGKRVLIYTKDDVIIGIIAAVRPMIPGAQESIEQLKQTGTEIWLITDGTSEESDALAELIHPDRVIFHPADDDIERLMAELDNSEGISAYISASPREDIRSSADITAAIGVGADPENTEAGILLSRNRLADFIYAINTSRQLNENITGKQVSVMIYHGLAVILFGFLLPVVMSIPLLPVTAVLCALAAVIAVLPIAKKEFR